MTTTSPPATLRASLAAALILTMTAAGSEAAAATLRWKFKAGDSLRYQLVQTQSMTTRVKEPAPQEFKQGFTLTIDQVWTVRSVDASGVASMAHTIERIRTTADLPVGKLTYDSKEAKDTGGPAGPLFRMLVGVEFTFKMNGRGEITDVKLPENVLATLRGDQEPAGAQGQFSEAGLKNMISQMGLLLPEGPVEPGATWSRKLAIPAGPDGQTRGTEQVYTYRGPEAGGGGQVEAIDLTIKYDPLKPDPSLPVTIKTQESRGRFAFDNAAGRIETSTVTEKVELSGTIMGKEIGQEGETSTVMTLPKGDPK
jgi:hypothetical protein